MHTPTPELEHKSFQSRDANLLQRYNWYIDLLQICNPDFITMLLIKVVKNSK